MAVYARTKIHYLSLTMVLISMVFFCVFQSVVAKAKTPSNQAIAKALEKNYFQCKGDLKAINEQNALMDKKIKKRDVRILGLLKDKKSLSICNEKFSELLGKLNNGKNARVQECPTDNLLSQIKNVSSNIVHQLLVEKDSALVRYNKLVRKMEGDIYNNMMATNIGPKLTEYDCNVIKKRGREGVNHTLDILKQKKWPVDPYKKLKDEQRMGKECKLKRSYILIQELVSWNEAMVGCAKRRMSFASVKSEKERKELHEVLKDHQLAWIGGVLYEGKWNWLDEPFSYTSWDLPEYAIKDRMKKGHNCIHVYVPNGSKFVNELCSRKLYYVCQTSGDY